MEIILFAIVMIYGYRLSHRMSSIESALKINLKEKHGKDETENEVVATSDTREEDKPYQAGEDLASKDDSVERYENSFDLVGWFKTDWMMKLGSLLILLGFGWLVSYAFMNNWIGEMGRITIGLVFGVLVLAFGEKRMAKVKSQGAVLLVLGSGVILVTIFAARELYDFFTPITALAVTTILVSYIAFSSVRNKYRQLAILGLIIGAIAPLLTNTPDPSMEGLFSYLFFLILGFLWIVRLTGWRILTVQSIIIAFLYSLPYMFNTSSTEQFTGLVIACAFSILFYFANIASIIFSRKAKTIDIVIAILIGLFYLGWIASVASEEMKWFFASSAGLFCVLGAFIVYKFSEIKDLIYVYSGKAVVYLSVAVAFELQGPAFVIALILISLVSTILNGQLTKKYYQSQKISFLIFVPTLMSIESMNYYNWRNGLIHDHFFVLLAMAVAYFLLAYYFSKNKQEIVEKNYQKNLNAYFIAGAIYSLLLIWFGLYAVIEKAETARVIALFTYTSIGIGFYIIGKIRDKKVYILPSEILLGLVVLRLLFVEVWNMAIASRIITFIFIGLMLIGSALIKSKKHEE